MSTTILVILVVVLLLMVMKLSGLVFALTGWMLKLLILAGMIVFLLWKIPTRRK